MTALLVLGLFILTALSLAAALFYLYRWLARRKLFPQLPRLWSGDRKRFILSLVGFAVFLPAFVVVSLFSADTAAVQARAGKSAVPPGPSFDGQPPPDQEAVAAARARREALQRVRSAAATAAAAPPTTAPPTTAPAQTTPPTTAPAAAPAVATTTTVPPTTAPPTTAPPATTTTTTTTAPPPPAPPAKAAKPKAAKPKARKAKARKAKAAKRKPYTVCAASFRDLASAKVLAARMAKKGVAAWVAKVNLKSKGRWFRVYLGHYDTSAQAQAKARSWRKQGVASSPFVVKLR